MLQQITYEPDCTYKYGYNNAHTITYTYGLFLSIQLYLNNSIKMEKFQVFQQ